MDRLQLILNSIIAPLEWIMLFLVVGGGLLLVLHSRFYPLKLVAKSFKLLFSRESNKGISRFQALTAVLAATVGLGNISGVSIAIHMGGPGVLVWMWLTAIIGSTIKFYSSTLAVDLREFDKNGNPLGGPMYYMKIGIKNYGKPLAICFSIAGLFGVLPAFTANQLTETFIGVINPSQQIHDIGNFGWKLLFGIFLSLVTAVVIFGGLKSIVKVSSNLVPLMVIMYLTIGISILILNWDLVLPTFMLIFSEAFNLDAFYSGSFWGLLVLGVRRAVFSNESGLGTAPMYHGQSESKEGISEGLVAQLGPILDTILVCTITGLIVIISQAYLQNDLNGILLTLEAFRKLFFGFGDILLMIMVFVFGISTLFTYSYYGVKCLGFLITPKFGRNYNYIYVLTIIISALLTVDIVISIIDISFAMMCIPNMIAVLILAPKVKSKMIEKGWF